MNALAAPAHIVLLADPRATAGSCPAICPGSTPPARAPLPGGSAGFGLMRGGFAVGAAAVAFRSLTPRSGSRR